MFSLYLVSALQCAQGNCYMLYLVQCSKRWESMLLTLLVWKSEVKT